MSAFEISEVSNQDYYHLLFNYFYLFRRERETDLPSPRLAAQLPEKAGLGRARAGGLQPTQAPHACGRFPQSHPLLRCRMSMHGELETEAEPGPKLRVIWDVTTQHVSCRPGCPPLGLNFLASAWMPVTIVHVSLKQERFYIV